MENLQVDGDAQRLTPVDSALATEEGNTHENAALEVRSPAHRNGVVITDSPVAPRGEYVISVTCHLAVQHSPLQAWGSPNSAKFYRRPSMLHSAADPNE
jgi:hypothetical protein